MLLGASAFLLGALYLQTFAYLPSLTTLSILLILSLIPCCLLKRRTYYYLIPIFILAFTYTTWFAGQRLSWSLPKNLEGETLIATGFIDSLPTEAAFGTRFIFWLESYKANQKITMVNKKIQLAWRAPSVPIKVGDKWQLTVKLKQIHGLQSPGAFDFEAWSLQKGLRATGYVVKGLQQKIGESTYYYLIERLRQKLQEKISQALPKTQTAPWLMALIIGERNGIAPGDWQVLRNTGTNHLMAIAGLHIGIIAGIAHLIAVALARQFPQVLLRIPAKQLGGLAALITAIFYSALAGFSIPTERACLMLSIFIAALLFRYNLYAIDAWSLALIFVLILNPLSVLTESFWLSFGTIALIIYGMRGRLKPSGIWWKWGRVQWIVGLGLTPLTLILFQQSSIISFVANSIAIPWLSFLILPFCLLSAIFLFIWPSLGAWFLTVADLSLSWLWKILAWFSTLPFATWHAAIPNLPILLLSLVGFFLLLLPAGFKGKWSGCFLLLPLFFYESQQPKTGDVWLTLLDVGQGLSLIIQTKHHTLLYDAGPRLSAQFDMGQSIVLPYLYQNRIRHLDKMMISHGDNDHIGGAETILTSSPVGSILTSAPDKLNIKSAMLCLSGQTWQWDGVKFKVLYPSILDQGLGNDSSCVLHIDNGEHQILLTGDIEKKAEEKLLERKVLLQPVTLLVAPHHGSKTSSTRAFIEKLKPNWVLYATGYRNRYRFPHKSVIERYDAAYAKQLNTAETGTMRFYFEKGKKTPTITLHRINHKRYWHNH